jgi:hypothetical protein
LAKKANLVIADGLYKAAREARNAVAASVTEARNALDDVVHLYLYGNEE